MTRRAFLVFRPLGWGPLSRTGSGLVYIVGVPLTSVERSGSGWLTPSAPRWFMRPRRHTPIRGETTWRAYLGVAHDGRPQVVHVASSAFTIGDPSMGISLSSVMSAGSRASTYVPSSRRATMPGPLHPESGTWYACSGAFLDERVVPAPRHGVLSHLTGFFFSPRSSSPMWGAPVPVGTTILVGFRFRQAAAAAVILVGI